MKLYIITVEDIYEFDSEEHDPIVRTSRKEARKVLNTLYRSGKECYQDQYDVFEKSPDSFSMYLDGNFGTGHYCASITAVDVPNIKRKLIKK